MNFGTFWGQNFTKLISRKIWVTEITWNLSWASKVAILIKAPTLSKLIAQKKGVRTVLFLIFLKKEKKRFRCYLDSNSGPSAYGANALSTELIWLRLEWAKKLHSYSQSENNIFFHCWVLALLRRYYWTHLDYFQSLPPLLVQYVKPSRRFEVISTSL